MSTPAFAADSSGGAICGTVWNDVNGDGFRQHTELTMADVGISVGFDSNANTDTNGNYCFTGLAAGTYTVQGNDLAFFDPAMDWTRPGGQSHVDWTDGTSAPITIGADTHIDHFDIGYVRSTADLRAGRIVISQNGNPVHHTQFHVGDTFQVFGAMKVTGNIPNEMGGELTVPAGMTVVARAGDLPSSVVTSTEVFGQAPGRLLPGSVEFIGATVRVDSPVTNGDITVDADLGIFDPNTANDVATRQISATP